jgi:hypothetical protein
MNANAAFRHYLIATNELLLEFAREAKLEADRTRGTQEGELLLDTSWAFTGSCLSCSNKLKHMDLK